MPILRRRKMRNIIMPNQNDVRLQKFMAECGVASRRKCEQLIEEGRVKVNGHVAALGTKINPKKDIVTLRGKRIGRQESPRYIMLNKPRGFVTTVSDELGRKTVMDLLDGVKERVYPVGRLDRDSEGLLLMTNDGALANALTHPSYEITKTYRVTVRGKVEDEVLQALREGVEIDSGKTAPCEVVPLVEETQRTVLEFKIHEGKNREIRKMLEHFGLEVIRLRRIAIAGVKLGMLKIGDYRDLNENELKKLFHACGMTYQPK